MSSVDRRFWSGEGCGTVRRHTFVRLNVEHASVPFQETVAGTGDLDSPVTFVRFFIALGQAADGVIRYHNQS